MIILQEMALRLKLLNITNQPKPTGENTMPKRETKKEQPETALMPTRAELANTQKLAGHIGELIIGNHIRKTGMLVEESYYQNMTKAKSDHQLAMYKLQLEQAEKLDTSGKAEEAKRLLETLADTVDIGLILNTIDGVVFGEKTAQEAMKLACEQFEKRVAQKGLSDARYAETEARLDTHEERVDEIEGRVDELENMMVHIVGNNVNQLANMQAELSSLEKNVSQITTQIKPLIQGRAEEELIRQLWHRIEPHPKLVAYCNTVRQSLHQRFFRSHFIQAGGAVASSGLAGNLAKTAVGQIPIAGFLAVAAVDVGLEVGNLLSNEIRQGKAELYVRCTESLKKLDILPELIALLLTCSYEEQLLCLKDKSVVSGTLPSAAGYGISLVEGVIQKRPNKSDIPEAYHGSVLGLALSIVEQVPVVANRSLRQELFTMFGFDSKIAKASSLSLEKAARGKADNKIDAQSWTVGSFYYKPGIKCLSDTGDMLHDEFYTRKDERGSQRYLYRWTMPENLELGVSARAKSHPYAAKYTDLFNQSPFLNITHILASSKAAQRIAAEQADCSDASASESVFDSDSDNSGSSARSRNDVGLGRLMADRNAQQGFLDAGAAPNSKGIPGVIFPSGFTGQQKAGKFVIEIDIDLFEKVINDDVQNILKGRRGVQSSFCPNYKKTSRDDISELVFSEKRGVENLIAALNTLNINWPDAPENRVVASAKKQ